MPYYVTDDDDNDYFHSNSSLFTSRKNVQEMYTHMLKLYKDTDMHS